LRPREHTGTPGSTLKVPLEYLWSPSKAPSEPLWSPEGAIKGTPRELLGST